MAEERTARHGSAVEELAVQLQAAEAEANDAGTACSAETNAAHPLTALPTVEHARRADATILSLRAQVDATAEERTTMLAELDAALSEAAEARTQCEAARKMAAMARASAERAEDERARALAATKTTVEEGSSGETGAVEELAAALRNTEAEASQAGTHAPPPAALHVDTNARTYPHS